MSHFITHQPCPKCGSSDAFAEYDDGHFWCFSCRNYVPPNYKSLKNMENYFSAKRELKKGELPHDFTKEIPKEPYAWLKQYSLTTEEISAYYGWSQSQQMLITSYYGEENDLLVWQGRYFPARVPKVYTSGYPDTHILLHSNTDGEYSRRVVVVEDSVSAIKVARVCTATPLLGSNLSRHKSVGLSRSFTHLTFWLDYDKLSSMMKQTEANKLLFSKVDMIVTEKDPKEYSTDEIKELLK
jgi:hypothetical protein